MAKRPGIFLRLLAWTGGFIVLVAIAIWVMTLVARHRLEVYRAALEAKGERFAVAALAPPPPPENAASAATTLFTACKDLNDDVVSKRSRLFSTGRLETVPGQAEALHSRKMAKQFQKDVPWEEFTANLEPFRPILAKIRDASRTSPLSVQLDYSKGYAMPLSFLPQGLRAAQYLAMESVQFLHEQRPDRAVDNAIVMLRLAGLMQEHPLMICQFCAISTMGIASATTWEILQSPVSPADLARLQAAWEVISLASQLPATLRMERAWACESFDRPFRALAAIPVELEISVVAPTHLPENPDEAWRMTQFTVWLALYRYSDEEQFIASHQKLIDSLTTDANLQTLMTVVSATAKDIRARGATRIWSSVATSATSDFLKRIVLGDSLQKLTIAAIAIQRYRLDHSGQFPESLEALVPAYLAAVPKDAMDLQPIRYHRTSESFQLYSIGINGTDDGGSTISLPGTKTKDFLERQDIVWPEPAP